MLQEYENCFKKANVLLRFIGMTVTYEDNKRTTWQRFKYHWICFVYVVLLSLSTSGQLAWLVLAIANSTSLLQITYSIPCITMSLLGILKMFYFIHKVQNINNVIVILRNLQSKRPSNGDTIEEKIMKKCLLVLINFSKLIIVLVAFGYAAFIAGPFVMIANYYYTTGTIKLYLPFLLLYPFDEFKVQNWPFVFLQQVSAAWVAVFCVLGPDSFFAVCCTFIRIQFLLLQLDLEQIFNKSSWRSENYSFKKKFSRLVNQHRGLIRCVQLVDQVYSKSTLFNVATSSLIICAAGFNLMTFKNYVLMAPFCAFLVFGLLQVFLYCYYGDMVMRSSMGVGDAVYNSRWYDAGANERKYLLIVLMRSLKPCKFTAYMFSDINLGTFNRILSTSWSYFALLNQMYEN